MEVPMKSQDDFTIDEIIAFAKSHYGDKTSLNGDKLLTHCVSVAAQAELIAQKLYQDVRADFMPDSTKDSIMAIACSAVLHEVLNVSDCAFEHIAETATVQIAAMVADISRDFRLVETKRDMEFRGRLSQSPVGAQIVVTADIICTARAALQLLDGSPDNVLISKIKKILTQLDGDLLAIHAASRYYMLRMYVHVARNLLIDVSQKIKNYKQCVRLNKIIASKTKTLREAAAKKPGTTQKKKKDVRYAKKRSNEQHPE
jgi:hypothetical protein